MESIFSTVASTVAIIGTIGLWLLQYASTKPEHRQRFWALVADISKAAARRSKRLGLKLFFLAAVLGAFAVAFSSGMNVLEFVNAAEPVTRREIFRLVIDIFNTTVYGCVAGAAVAGFFIPSRAKQPAKELLVIHRCGETLRVLMAPGADTKELLAKLQNEGIDFNLSDLSDSQQPSAAKATDSPLVVTD